MEKFPMLRFVVRFGSAAALVIAVMVAALLAWIGAGALGWVSIPVALLVGGLVFALAKMMVEPHDE